MFILYSFYRTLTNPVHFRNRPVRAAAAAVGRHPTRRTCKRKVAHRSEKAEDAQQGSFGKV
jgi:hypothetical protein